MACNDVAPALTEPSEGGLFGAALGSNGRSDRPLS
jgi:hypothetical protein